MRPRLAFVQLSVAEQPAHISVVLAELLDAATRREIINPAVTHMTEIHPAGSKPAQAHGRFHAATFIVAAAQVSQRAMHLCVQLRQHIRESRLESTGGVMKRAGQQFGNLFHRDPARVFAGQRAAHSIADRERHVAVGHGRFAVFAEVLNFARVKAQAEEGILVVLPDLSAIRPPKPFHADGSWR